MVTLHGMIKCKTFDVFRIFVCCLGNSSCLGIVECNLSTTGVGYLGAMTAHLMLLGPWT